MIRLIIKIFKKAGWLCQFYSANIESTNFNARQLSIDNSKRILILIPHADDELIGCFQLINLYREDISGYYFGFVGTNTEEGNKRIRLSEIIKGFSNSFGLKLHTSNGEYTKELHQLILEIKPNLVALPSFVDWHKEHIQTSVILNRVLLELKETILEPLPNICLYQISVPISEETITHYIPMNKIEQKTKWKTFKDIYRSQKNIPIFRFTLQERLAGRLIGKHAAETYIIYSFEKWSKLLAKYLEINVDQYQLEQKIQNIKLIRDESKKIYEIINYT